VETDLAEPGSGIGLSVKIPDGMRAISIRSNDVVGVAGFLYPGSHVDVLLTYHGDTSAAPLTQTILQDITVLTAGQTLEPDPKGKPQTVNVVTLLLDPHDSQKLVLASQQGSVQFVLRNGADQSKPDSKPVLASQLIADAAPATAKPHLAIAAPRAPRPPEFYTVETIAGDKHTVEKF
jgi:pilus assembly protein CpaB